MLILGLDFETTGVDHVKDRVLEVGAALQCTDTGRTIRQEDYLVVPDIPIPDEVWAEVTPIHGITKELVEKYGVMQAEGLDRLNWYVEQAEAIVAFNGTEFDQLFYQEWNTRRYMHGNGWWLHKRWIDTRLDVPEPIAGSLITLCAKAGFLNPFPHQALSDVLSMLRLLGKYDMEQVVERARIPNVHVQALVSFDDKDKAKERGYWFTWNTHRPFKAWVKKIKECDLEQEAKSCPFKVKRVEVNRV